jgi:hypothetical protein
MDLATEGTEFRPVVTFASTWDESGFGLCGAKAIAILVARPTGIVR